MNFLPEPIQAYADQHTEPASDLLKKIERDTHLHVLHPRMLSGSLQGRILSMISYMLRPVRILELGTYTGYSALCLAEGLSDTGQVVTLDNNQELEDRVRGYFDESAYGSKIELLIGEALDLIPTLNETWDLVFIDADKVNYFNYFNLVIDSVRHGGYIVADNVLWSGKVVDQKEMDVDTEAIRSFNQAVRNDPRVVNVLLPIRDGLMLSRKL